MRFNPEKINKAAGEEIEPPWIAFPHSSPIHGWNQGETEYWKLNVWLPFWTTMSEIERDRYLQRWQPPNDDWKESITAYWVGKIPS